MQRRSRLGWKLAIAFVVGFVVALVWMYAILHISVDPDVAINPAMKIAMFITAPPFLLAFGLGGMVYGVPFLNGLFYAALAYLWHITRRASRHRRSDI